MNEARTKTLTTSFKPSDSSISHMTSSNVLLDMGNSIVESSNVVNFPKPYLGKESNKKEEIGIQIKKSSNTVNGSEADFGDVMEYLHKAVEIGESLKLASNYNFSAMHDEKDIRIKEAEEKMQKTQKIFNLYKYYSFIWILSVFLLGLFTALFVVGVLSAFSFISGITATLVGIIGAYLDWKAKERNYDS
ncbi:hypothetical protein [Lysinibacillus sp. FW12]|uniref:hypothetical protein n=1 Tax=Lysinibacillus sp. FW12 TaxID=3096079 RepID=UPI003D716B39